MKIKQSKIKLTFYTITSNSDNYFTSRSDLDQCSKNLDSSNQYENDLFDKALDKTSSKNENDFFNASQLTSRRRIASPSSFNNKITRNSRNKASIFDYTKLHNFWKRTRHLTRNTNKKSIENLIENVNYLWDFVFSLQMFI